MNHLLLAVLLSCSSFIYAGQLNYAQLQQLTISPDQLEGRFTQQKYLNDMEISLQSSGVFEYQRGASFLY